MSQTSKQYQCKTQDGRMPTFGAAPASHLHPNHENHEGIVLGIGSIVPRWDVIQQPNRKLQYFVRKDTFPSGDAAQLAASVLQEAADEWNKLNLGLTITSTNDQGAANFYLVYKTSSDPTDTTLAMAFFPNEANQDVLVFGFAFDQENKPIMKNVFMHELGHVLGLRHEFAITGDSNKGLGPEGEGAVQFMTTNYNSIMSYNFPPTIQQTDKDGIQAFYKLKNGFKIGNSPVTDYLPQIRKKN
ncbi:hypothetical protein LTR10_018715 [Elasticomyces elasticus]|uniref:Peptidase metallopeptidase domain-containing protein n=1 Tax=Exophiala sideris TaxID=1016849 RepID=A0ABR0JB44_9EURO|nr:hypothetical protein LTR10_018715 [Elasticomyces elasticus]KAK5026248.1 hypothetical protein LTS07_007773 [Exophiala sideris]KAK5032501.1 hypothetical protein LTR13_007324 [Exophiala sideris]KAK5059660.1 hypothetical protein LTR69_006249 [Exophiala sideris]KAK5178056.1 hypothetical protein LTR44_009362 [Eurotiomycetes sp. CCFEE 6388]